MFPVCLLGGGSTRLSQFGTVVRSPGAERRLGRGARADLRQGTSTRAVWDRIPDRPGVVPWGRDMNLYESIPVGVVVEVGGQCRSICQFLWSVWALYTH